jgi:hypothetical protein
MSADFLRLSRKFSRSSERNLHLRKYILLSPGYETN